MPLSTFTQTNFTSGELSPRLLGRSDLSKYFNGVQTLENFLVQKHGGAISRSGTRFVNEVKDSTRLTRLIPFQFSVSQTYILEFGNLYIRFYRDKGRLLSSGTTPTEITSPWSDTQLRELKFTQSADVLYICHPDFETRTLSRGAGDDNLDATWTLAAFAATDGPYQAVNTTAVTMTPGSTTGNGISLTASADTFVTTDQDTATQTGRLIRLKHGSTWGYAEIVGFTSATVVTIDIKENFGASTATSDWRLGAWSDTTGWPHCNVFHQLRLWFGGTDDDPQTLWASSTGDFTNFEPSAADENVEADMGITYTISDDRVNTISWLASDAKGLLILTDGGAFLGRSSREFSAITATIGDTTDDPLNTFRQNTDGVHDLIRPQQIGSVLLYVKSAGRRLLELAFRIEDEKFVSPDLTILSEHITLGGVVDSAFQSEQDNTLFLARTDGQLLSMTYERDQNVIGWSRHIIGGSLTGSDQPKVESIAAIRDTNDDLLWMVVERTVDGSTKRYIEFMETNFALDDKVEDGFFGDSGKTYDSAAVLTITGLDHLKGETVVINANGATHPPVVVTSDGKITLREKVSKAQIGLKFTPKIKTMPIISQSPGLDPRGKQTRPYRVAIMLHNTLGGSIGFTPNIDTIDYRTPGDPMTQGLPLFTGIKDKTIQASADRQPVVEVQQNDPMPITVSSLIIETTLEGV